VILYLFHNDFWTARDYAGALAGDCLLVLLAYMVVRATWEAWSEL
jgi:hypothetical protein